MRTQRDRNLRGVLRDEAGRHLPDREAMLARISRRRDTRRRRRAMLRPAAAALAVAVVLVAGISGIHLAGREPAEAGGAREFLSATATLDPHSIPDWSQSNLTLTTTDTLTALDVTIRVARTAGVADTGHWTTIPREMVTTGVTKTGAAYVYRFTLHAGATLAPGSYTFAAQYQHATGPRSPAGDSYQVSATGNDPAQLAGGFTG